MKDKIITLESLSALHEHNKDAYMTQVNPAGSGSFSMDGNGLFDGSVEANYFILKSSSENSEKRFKITIDDSGSFNITEIVDVEEI